MAKIIFEKLTTKEQKNTRAGNFELMLPSPEPGCDFNYSNDTPAQPVEIRVSLGCHEI